jgi:NAD(P)-dependent dehydrogenase (short-subunit alcohol dehydrogenase family)
VALDTGGSRGIGAAIVRRLAADWADVPSVFVTNGGYNGVQQVLAGDNQNNDYDSSDKKPPLSLNFAVNAPRESERLE